VDTSCASATPPSSSTTTPTTDVPASADHEISGRSATDAVAGAPQIHAIATARLQDDGQRYTPRRRALVELLAEVDQPLTIPQLLEQRRELAQSSVYRNLGVLERAGVVHRIVTSDEFARYELAEDLTQHHHHLICASCGDVSDFTVPESVEQELDAALRKVARRAGFRVTDHKLDLVGTCPRCT
jgi:Fur family ferric uptake transcriptional regulator